MKKVERDLRRTTAYVWLAILVIVGLSFVPEDKLEAEFRALASAAIGGVATTALFWRISLNGGTVRAGTMETNGIAEEANELAKEANAAAKEANIIAKKAMLVSQAELMDAKVHKRAFDLVLIHPEVNEEHVRLFIEEEYSTLPRCIKLQKLGEKFPGRVNSAMKRAREEE